jgi:uncharacterized membrane protein
MSIKGFKAYNKGLVCRGFQFEEGKTYEVEGKPVRCGNNGFHACENPLDVLDYYDLCESEFTEVEALGDVDKDADGRDTKFATNKIKIGAKLGLSGFIKASFDFLWEQCKLDKSSGDKIQTSSGVYSKLASSGDSSKLVLSGDCSQLASSGDSNKLASSGVYSKLVSSGDCSQLVSSGNCSQLVSSGNCSQLASSGDYSKLASSGDYSKLASSGNCSQLASSGDYSKLASSGDCSKLASSGVYSKLASSGDCSQLAISGAYSAGAAIGHDSKIKGKKGNWITLAEWEYNDELKRWVPVCVKSAQIDGKIIKEDVWYKLADGEFTECE